MRGVEIVGLSCCGNLVTPMPDNQRNLLTGLALLFFTLLLVTFGAALLGSRAGEVAGATGGVLGGLAGALGAYVGVLTAIRAQARADRQRRREELAAIRLAIYTEIRMVSFQCDAEYWSWQKIAWKEVRGFKALVTSNFPPLSIYTSLAGSVGRLSEAEIVSLVSFAGQLHDIQAFIGDLANDARAASSAFGPYDLSHVTLIAEMWARACDYAANFIEAASAVAGVDLPGPQQDLPTIQRLHDDLSANKAGHRMASHDAAVS